MATDRGIDGIDGIDGMAIIHIYIIIKTTKHIFYMYIKLNIC